MDVVVNEQLSIDIDHFWCALKRNLLRRCMLQVVTLSERGARRLQNVHLSWIERVVRATVMADCWKYLAQNSSLMNESHCSREALVSLLGYPL